MHYPDKIDLDRIASKDDNRPHLCQPYLDTTDEGDPRIVACDGHRLVAVSVELDEGDVTGPVPRGAMKAAADKSVAGVSMLSCGGTDIRCDAAGVTFDRPQGLDPFPDWRAIVPKRKSTVHVTLNAKLLREIGQSVGTEIVTLHLVPDEGGNVVDQIRVEPACCDAKTIAVLMPIVSSGSEG